eukprot:UN22931
MKKSVKSQSRSNVASSPIINSNMDNSHHNQNTPVKPVTSLSKISLNHLVNEHRTDFNSFTWNAFSGRPDLHSGNNSLDTGSSWPPISMPTRTPLQTENVVRGVHYADDLPHEQIKRSRLPNNLDDMNKLDTLNNNNDIKSNGFLTVSLDRRKT